jgi:hypothetical protein
MKHDWELRGGKNKLTYICTQCNAVYILKSNDPFEENSMCRHTNSENIDRRHDPYVGMYKNTYGPNTVHRGAFEFTGIKIFEGSIFYFKNGNVSRDDGPAVIQKSGERWYYLNDVLYDNIKTDDEWLIKQIIE